MDITESERNLRRVPSASPVFRLLYCAGNIFPDPPVLALPHGRLKIGREVAEHEGIRLRLSRRASREHALCEVQERDGGYAVQLYDLGSKNGTQVNGQICAASRLHEGDLVRIGDSLLLLRNQAAQRQDAAVPRLQGASMAIGLLRKRIAELAPAPAPVLLLGESGTGKDLAAQSLHELSGRSGRLVSVNCSAIPESLAESHLFGHLPGSFTGATVAHDGLFRAAQGGTLFLDEVGELPPSVQPKLLRVLEDQTITPIGTSRALKVYVRIVAATNRDLQADVAAGRFRKDLYARLCALVVHLPPLRVRREDILPLISTALGPTHPPLTTALAEALVLHEWPLNVRELIQLATHLTYCGGELTEFDLPQVEQRLGVAQWRLTSSAGEPTAAKEDGDDAKDGSGPSSPPPKPVPREEVQRLLKEHHGVIARVAAVVGRSPRQVRRWIEQYKLDARRLDD